MSKNLQSTRTVARELAMAAAILAAIALSPVKAAADPAASDQKQDAPSVQATPTDVPGSELREGSEVRASSQESDAAVTATTIDPQGQASNGQAVQTMNPDDPEWDAVHSGG